MALKPYFLGVQTQYGSGALAYQARLNQTLKIPGTLPGDGGKAMTQLIALTTIIHSTDETPDKTTSHLTNPAKYAGLVIGYSHSARLSKGFT
jgi:hypothetical protein